MRGVIYHPAARVDLRRILAYYTKESGSELAAEFFAEFTYSLGQIAARPDSFIVFKNHLRRVNMRRFPYHLLFEIIDEKASRILVVKHDHRDPSFVLGRL